MPRIISTTIQQAVSIFIIQGAYEKFCAPANSETVYKSQQHSEVTFASSAPASLAATQEDWIRFQRLVEAWRQERGAMSSITESATCPAYQSIIGIGEIAIPFIVASLRSEGDEPDQWFWALKAITGADPVSNADRGNFLLMAQAWIAWAKENGYAR